jgi:hypothetical protein
VQNIHTAVIERVVPGQCNETIFELGGSSGFAPGEMTLDQLLQQRQLVERVQAIVDPLDL